MVYRRVLLHPDSLGGAGLPPLGPRPGTVPGTAGGQGLRPPSSANVVRPSADAPAGPRPVNGPPPVPTRTESEEAVSKIRALDQRLAGGSSRHEDNWKRSPNVTGTGAIHCKSFHCKLTGDSLENLDRQINEWLDAHPQYEVKFVTTSVGEWTGKLREPNLIVQVWV